MLQPVNWGISHKCTNRSKEISHLHIYIAVDISPLTAAGCKSVSPSVPVKRDSPDKLVPAEKTARISIASACRICNCADLDMKHNSASSLPIPAAFVSGAVSISLDDSWTGRSLLQAINRLGPIGGSFDVS